MSRQKQSFKHVKAGESLVIKGHLSKKVQNPTTYLLTLEDGTSDNKAICFLNMPPQHPDYQWWKTAPDKFYAEVTLTVKEPYNEQFKSFKFNLNGCVPTEYIPPMMVAKKMLIARLREHVASIKNSDLSALCKAFLNNKVYREAFYQAPNSLEHGGRFHGGLLIHVVDLLDRIEMQAQTPSYYQELMARPMNFDLLKTAAIFHDARKIQSYEGVEGAYKLSHAEHFLGSTLLSLNLTQELMVQLNIERQQQNQAILSPMLMLELQHIIASCNERLEFGAFVKPATKEAGFFSTLENTSTRLSHYDLLEDSAAEAAFVKLFDTTVWVEPGISMPQSVEQPLNPQTETSPMETPAINPLTATPILVEEDAYLVNPSAHLESIPGFPMEQTVFETNTVTLPDVFTTDAPMAESIMEPIPPTEIVQPIPLVDSTVSEHSITPIVMSQPLAQEVLTSPAAPEVQIPSTTQSVTPQGSNPYVSAYVPQPAILTPTMNIPQTWPETPSTPPVLANGMPIQPVMPIQQPINPVVTPIVMPTVESPIDPFTQPVEGIDPFAQSVETIDPFAQLIDGINPFECQFPTQPTPISETDAVVISEEPAKPKGKSGKGRKKAVTEPAETSPETMDEKEEAKPRGKSGKGRKKAVTESTETGTEE